MVRVQLNDGERVVGIRYPAILIQEVEKAMKEQQMMEKAQQSLLAQAVSNTYYAIGKFSRLQTDDIFLVFPNKNWI